jgi:hypothetical protein
MSTENDNLLPAVLQRRPKAREGYRDKVEPVHQDPAQDRARDLAGVFEGADQAHAGAQVARVHLGRYQSHGGRENQGLAPPK